MGVIVGQCSLWGAQAFLELPVVGQVIIYCFEEIIYFF